MALRTRADHISPGSRPELLDRRLQNRRSCYQLGSLGCCNPVEHERVAVADDAMRASFGINASEDHPWSDTLFWWSGTASIRRPPVVQTDAHIRMGTGAMKFSEPYEAGRQHAPFRSPPSVPWSRLPCSLAARRPSSDRPVLLSTPGNPCSRTRVSSTAATCLATPLPRRVEAMYQVWRQVCQLSRA